MSKKRWGGVISVALILLVLGGILVKPAVQTAAEDFFYPKPTRLPPVITEDMEALLTRLQVTLTAKAPSVAQSLQAGLSDERITTLEQQGGFRLSAELRLLYRWHDGMTASGELQPVRRFMPLADVVKQLASLKEQEDHLTFTQSIFSKALTSHRKTWVPVIQDAAGDGYYFDPARSDAEGAFFYNFTETGDYLWFPSLKNFLAGLTECYVSGAISAKDGILSEDYEKTELIWERLGSSSMREQ